MKSLNNLSLMSTFLEVKEDRQLQKIFVVDSEGNIIVDFIGNENINQILIQLLKN